MTEAGRTPFQADDLSKYDDYLSNEQSRRRLDTEGNSAHLLRTRDEPLPLEPIAPWRHTQPQPQPSTSQVHDSCMEYTPQPSSSHMRKPIPAMPSLLANAFASHLATSPPLSPQPPTSVPLFASHYHNMRSFDQNTPQAIDEDLASDYEALSSSPTVVGSSPPPASDHLKAFYSLSTLPPPRIPFTGTPRKLRDIEAGPTYLSLSASSTPRRLRDIQDRPPPSIRPLSPQRLVTSSSRLPQSRQRDAYSLLDETDPNETWSSLPSKKRPPPAARAPVKKSGAFRLPLPTNSGPSMGVPFTARVKTFIPLPRHVAKPGS
jgi:hypothetical protein